MRKAYSERTVAATKDASMPIFDEGFVSNGMNRLGKLPTSGSHTEDSEKSREAENYFEDSKRSRKTKNCSDDSEKSKEEEKYSEDASNSHLDSEGTFQRKMRKHQERGESPGICTTTKPLWLVYSISELINGLEELIP